MPRIITAILLLGLLPTTAHADECFCLTHESGAILRGCEARGELLLCTDPFTAKKSVQRINPDWKRIEAGADLCTVCSALPRGTTSERPRGDGDEKRQSQ